MLHGLARDGALLFVTRFTRLFSYGALSVVLVFYLTSLGLSESQTGLLLTLTLLGDTAVSLVLMTPIVPAITRNFLFLVIAGTIGVISPSGNEVGPFLPIEQAALSQVVPAGSRTEVFAWYTLTGALATAAGSLAAGLVTLVASERAVVLLYAALGLLLAFLFRRLTPAAEVHPDASASPAPRTRIGVGSSSRAIVLRLSALFALDAFGGGFVIQSLAAYWFYLRFGVKPATLGGIFFGANVFAGFSALVASRLAARFGLVRTMVFTHLPSNILLMLVPLMPNLTLATLVLLVRFSISQMDVPTRQSYTMAIVRPEERSAAAGITGVARTTGAAIAPVLAGLLFARPSLINVPFFIAGTLKIAYDLLLYRAFVRMEPSEEAMR